jgi:hypothetical protein
MHLTVAQALRRATSGSLLTAAAGLTIASPATLLQASIGNVAAGSVFAFCWSAAMGGYAVTAISVAGGGAAAGAAVKWSAEEEVKKNRAGWFS